MQFSSQVLDIESLNLVKVLCNVKKTNHRIIYLKKKLLTLILILILTLNLTLTWNLNLTLTLNLTLITKLSRRTCTVTFYRTAINDPVLRILLFNDMLGYSVQCLLSYTPYIRYEPATLRRIPYNPSL